MRVRAAITLVLLAACGKHAPPPAAASEPSCVDFVVGDNTPETQAVFDARQCQGGGVTWAALLHVLVARHGQIDPRTYHINPEGDAAQLCASPALVQAIRADYEQLNHDPAELRRAMAASNARDLECDAAGSDD